MTNAWVLSGAWARRAVPCPEDATHADTFPHFTGAARPQRRGPAHSPGGPRSGGTCMVGGSAAAAARRNPPPRLRRPGCRDGCGVVLGSSVCCFITAFIEVPVVREWHSKANPPETRAHSRVISERRRSVDYANTCEERNQRAKEVMWTDVTERVLAVQRARLASSTLSRIGQCGV